MKKKNEKKDYSVLLHITFIALLLLIGLFIYIAGGKNNLSNFMKQAEKQDALISSQKEEQKPIKLQPFRKFKYIYSYTIDIQGYIKNLELEFPIPLNEKEKQYLSNVKVSMKPSRLYSDGVNTIAKYSFQNIGSRRMEIVFEGEANVRTYNINNAKAINKNLTPEKDLKRYLKPEPLIESDDPYIKSIARKIKGDSQEEILQNIYEYIQDNMQYRIINNVGAKKALQQGYGKCSEYAAIMIALCRAKKIPARMILGNIAREKYPQHNWVEVYYDKYGWVMYDPTVDPVNVRVLDAQGNITRTEKRYNTSPDINYITAGRNKLSTYTSSYSIADNRNGNARVTEDIKIIRLD